MTARARRSLAILAKSFRIVAVGRETGGSHAVDAFVRETVRTGNLQNHASRTGIELYASWGIGAFPHIGLEGVLPGSDEEKVESALKSIRAAEARSRIIIDYGRLQRLAVSLRKKGARIVFTNGVFDLVHAGHLRLLEMARRLGDVLIVGINSDDSTRSIKGESRPVVPQFARARTLVALRAVDYCCVFTESDPKKILAIIRPDVLAKGSDYSPRAIVGGRFVKGYGGSVARLPIIGGFSTTATINRILGGKQVNTGL